MDPKMREKEKERRDSHRSKLTTRRDPHVLTWRILKYWDLGSLLLAVCYEMV
jgi:hypothetical protein